MARTGESYSTARGQLARRARGTVSNGPFVVVPIADMRRAVDFYAEALGLSVRSVVDAWAVLGHGDEETIALEPNTAVGVDLGIGLRVADLPAVLERVRERGGAVLDHAGPSARIADPDGNIVRLLGTIGPPT